MAQGYEAGGHRGSYDQAAAERQGAALARLEPAGDFVRRIWAEARAPLPEP